MAPDDVLTVVGGRTVAGVLEDGAYRHPDRALLVFEGPDGAATTYTWAEMRGHALALAARLAAMGLGPGDRLHVHLGNRPEFLVAWFAAAELAVSIVPTNTAASEDELAYLLEHSGAAASIADASGAARVAAARERAGSDGETLLCERDRLLELPPAAAPVAARRPMAGDELAVLYTSGTTSRPKGVRVTHANYVYAGEVVAGALRLTAEDRFLTVLPLFHANAQYYSTMGTLVAGGTIVLADRFSATRFLDQAVRHEATVASLFAAPIRMILAQRPDPRRRDHRLRVVLFAQNLEAGELDRWDELVGAPLLQLYGMTETIGPPLMNPLTGSRRHSAIGRAALGYACRILRDDGSPADVGEPGQLVVRGVRASRSWQATCTTRPPPTRCWRTAGCAPATSSASMRTGWSASSTAART